LLQRHKRRDNRPSANQKNSKKTKKINGCFDSHQREEEKALLLFTQQCFALM
jgi:hypothetical protein